MSIIVADRIAKSFDPDDIFWDISCSVAQGDRIALVGRNGTGKTTLLRILAGLEPPTQGRVQRAKGLRIGFLPQTASLEGDRTLWQEMMTAFASLQKMQSRLHALEAEMADPARAEAALEAYAPLRERFEVLGGYTYEDQVRHVLMGLGFAPGEQEMPLSHLSGGQKTRALLARLLFESPDLLLLDEPTNHLDMQAIEWLEGYLSSWEGTVILVAHDRYFLDRVAHKVWELAFGGLEIYAGNYSHYVQQRADRHERRLKDYYSQQAFIAKEEDFIQRYMAGQRSRQAKGRLRRLERLKRDDIVDRPREEQTIRLHFEKPLRSGDKVIWSQDLIVGYRADAPLFRCPDLDLRRGECVALLGPNGSGKTTFLRTLLGEIQPLAGYARLGASLKLGYFAQARTELDPDKSVLDTILAIKNLPLGEARSFLAQFLFTGDDVFKQISMLSGGERSRVALACLVLQRANLLLLDEPTNHLDIASQEVLEAVLDGFTGTIVLVTHDRYLVDSLATQIWIIKPEEQVLEAFEGSWAEYAAAREEGDRPPEGHQRPGTGPALVPKDSVRRRGQCLSPRGSGTPQVKGKWSDEQRDARREERRARREEAKRRQRVVELETQIHHLDEQLKSLQQEITAASEAQEAMRLHELGTIYAELEQELQKQMEIWAELAG